MIRAKCDLSIELDQPERRYRPGDIITGLVRVEVDRETKCEGLTLSYQWRTHGRGNRAEGFELPDELFRGQWRPGTYTYPFRIVCPHEPVTYHGEALNLDWYLDARTDVPWAIDAKTSVDFFVDYGAEAAYELVVGFDEDSKLALSSTLAPTPALLLLLVPGLGAGFYMLYLGLTDHYIALLAGLAWLGIVGFFAFTLVKKRVAKSAFTRFDWRVSGGVDGPLVVELDYGVRQRVNAVEAKLIAEEVVVSGSGTNESIHCEIVSSSSARQVVGASAGTLRFELDVPHPSTVGYSFEVEDNQLRWYVVLDCDIESWPDLEQRLGLELRPQRGRDEEPYRAVLKH